MKKGFTLIELVIYIALFGILMTTAVSATTQLLENGARNKLAVGTEEEGTFILRKFNWILSGAQFVSTSGSSLTVTRIPGQDFASTDNPVIFSVNNGLLLMQRGGGDPVPLNSDGFLVKNLSFSVTTNTVNAIVQTVVSVAFEINNIPFVFKTYLRQ